MRANEIELELTERERQRSERVSERVSECVSRSECLSE